MAPSIRLAFFVPALTPRHRAGCESQSRRIRQERPSGDRMQSVVARSLTGKGTFMGSRPK